jgi:hypothetical protein
VDISAAVLLFTFCSSGGKAKSESTDNSTDPISSGTRNLNLEAAMYEYLFMEWELRNYFC